MLLARCRLMLDALEQAEPGPPWPEFRGALEANANRVKHLRTLAREFTTLVALLPSQVKRDLDRGLARNGIDLAADRAREREAIETIRGRGRIRSEAEYRRVQAYADGLAQPEQQEEYLALGALLDEFMSRRAI